MQASRKVIVVSLLLAGCTTVMPLSGRVGHNVELSGRLSGPGKEGLYVLSAGEPVYLSDYAGSIPIGNNVLVKGKLQWVGDASSCPDASDCPDAARMAHYFIMGAQVRVAP